MKIGVYQFSSTNSIKNNLETIKKAICLAAGQGVRLVVFHECALCGYPPIEQSIDDIHNVMTVVSVNSTSRFQTAPTAVFDYNGEIEKEAEPNVEGLLVYDFTKPETTFGMKGRLVNNDYFLQTGSSRK